jgi:hypothetical protein
MIRDCQDGTEENVRELLRNAGLPTDDETVKRMAAESISELLKAQMEARASGADPAAMDTDALLRNAVNRDLATSGQEPLPEPGKTPTVTPGGTSSPSPSAQTSESPSPVPTETPSPPTPTPVPPTATPVPPTATPAPRTPTLVPPSPTPTPTKTVKKPTITVSGGFTDGNGFATTFTLTTNLESGGVSGSIRGSRSGELRSTCTDPTGKILDTAIATETETYAAGVAGGVGADGGYSASFSGIVTSAAVLTRPFTVSCIGGEPALPTPAQVPIGGTLSGSATSVGAVSVTSSLGGSWAGPGSIS